MLIFAFREYGAIDDVDIDLHIDVTFLDVSISVCTVTVICKQFMVMGVNLNFVSLLILLVTY